MSRKQHPFNMPAPYLREIWLDKSRVPDAAAYPFCLPLFQNDFELSFDHAITIVVGENGTGKSTLLEGIAALAGYDDAGGGKGYRTVDHSRAVDANGGLLAKALRASWLPKLTNGGFFKAESFFSVARYLDQAALDAGAAPPDFLSHSHGARARSPDGAQRNPGFPVSSHGESDPSHHVLRPRAASIRATGDPPSTPPPPDRGR